MFTIIFEIDATILIVHMKKQKIINLFKGNIPNNSPFSKCCWAAAYADISPCTPGETSPQAREGS